MDPLSETWTSDGVEHTYTTSKGINESQDEYEARFAETLAWLKGRHPPDPED